MDPGLESLYNAYNQEIGTAFGQGCRLYRRPGGSAVDQTPTLINTLDFKVEKGRNILAQPAIYNAQYYMVFGNFGVLQQGDILVPYQSSSTTPITTFLSGAPGEAYVSVRTSRLCSFGTSHDNILYTNVRFDFLPSGFSRSNFEEVVLGEGAQPTMQAILFSLPGIQQTESTHSIVGSVFIDTTGSVPVSYRVSHVEEIYPLIQLTLTQERGGNDYQDS